jgi:dTDP-4-amino-4,6-dideoxygalactose transaminase
VRAVPEREAGHVYHLFVVRSAARDRLQAHCESLGVETLIHYPIPIPRQAAFAAADPAVCPHADRACGEVLSLPLGPGLTDAQIDQAAGAVRAFPG